MNVLGVDVQQPAGTGMNEGAGVGGRYDLALDSGVVTSSACRERLALRREPGSGRLLVLDGVVDVQLEEPCFIVGPAEGNCFLFESSLEPGDCPVRDGGSDARGSRSLWRFRAAAG